MNSRPSTLSNQAPHIELFNFDHGLGKPHVIEVGPYRIEITAEDCERLTRLPRSDVTQFSHDSQDRRIIMPKSGQRGAFLPTARAIRTAPLGSSVLFPRRPEISFDYDLVLLLSFLSGRRVYLETEIDEDPRRSYSSRVVSPEFIVIGLQRAWQNLGNLERAGLSDALYCVVHGASTSELIGRGAYVNAAFDSMVTNWATKEARTTFANRPAIQAGIAKLVAHIDRALLNRARAALVTYFKLEGVSDDVTRDIQARLTHLGTGPSAMMKTRGYLETGGLFPASPTEEEIKRLKRLNVIRNAIAHNGTIRLEKELGAEATDRIAAASIVLVQDIVELGIALEMGLDDHLLQRTRTDIQKFFATGAFRGHSVVDETYQEFLDRAAADWAAEGLLP